MVEGEEYEPIPTTIFGHFRSAQLFFQDKNSKLCEEQKQVRLDRSVNKKSDHWYN